MNYQANTESERDEIERIAEGLSEVERGVLIGAQQTSSGHWYCDPPFAVEQSLRAKGLGRTIGNMYFSPTRKAIKVRTHLQEQSK